MVYTTIVGMMENQQELDKFNAALEQPLPHEIEKPSQDTMDAEMSLFMSSMGIGG